MQTTWKPIQIDGTTLPEIFYRRAKRTPDYEVFFTKKNGQWEAITFKTALDHVLKAMAGLRRLGFKKGDKIVIFSENRFEWILTDYAAQWLGGATAAIYTTNTAEQIRYILDESQGSVLFISNEAMLRKLDSLQNLQSLKYIVAWDSIQNRSTPANVKFVDRQEFLERNLDEEEAQKLLAQISPEDLAILLYTSGTTGEPKGVMISHHNLVSNLRMIVEAMPIQERKTTISFLPLSHIYERAMHNLMVVSALKIYFAESIERLIDNLQEVRPHLMTAVPRIFEKMYARINERIKNASALRRSLFYWAQSVGEKTFEYRIRGAALPLTWGILYDLADFLVFKKIRAVTGGRAELFVSGGAPISTDIQQFFFRAGFTILEGYGISETCILAVNRVNRFKFGTVGQAFQGTEFKIAEDGEILVRGPQVMKGYYRRDDATAEVFTPDGWYMTGDVGEIDSEGFLKITDRKKELLKTSGGKFVAPQPIENALKKDPLVEFSCVVGDGRKYVTALIVPSFEVARSWGEARGQKWTTLKDCASSPLLQARLRENLTELNRTLPQYSTIKDFRILDQSFGVDSGELTPTMKLKRRVIQDKFRSVIDSMYPEEDTFSISQKGGL